MRKSNKPPIYIHPDSRQTSVKAWVSAASAKYPKKKKTVD